MKCKVTREPGYWRLYGVVDDYEILLASMTNFFETGNWILKDVRYREMIWIPSSHIAEQSDTYKYKTEEERDFICEQLHTYHDDTDKQILHWLLYEFYRLDGDLSLDQRYYKNNITACWSFKKAREELYKAKKFWENYTEDLTSVKYECPWSQKLAWHLNPYVDL